MAITALHLALVALGISKDDGYISNRNGAYGPFAIYVGAKPVFLNQNLKRGISIRH